MLLTEIYASGFRCFGERAPLSLRVAAGITTLVGENDSGKTAIVDAVRFALGTRSEDYPRLRDSDFHVDAVERASVLRVRCTLEQLTQDEQSRFLEWCTFTEAGEIVLHVSLRARRTVKRGKARITYERRCGPDGDGPPIEGDLREFLRVAFLRPLRDAERELRPGRRSRLSEILAALPDMRGQETSSPGAGASVPTIADILGVADKAIESNPAIVNTQTLVNDGYLRALSLGSPPTTAALRLGRVTTLTDALERLELLLRAGKPLAEDVPRGLGLNNVLFMAAELLLLQYDGEALGLLLVEEPEAHLHPQLQARFMSLLRERIGETGNVQAVLTTHSPLLAASADVESLVLTTAAAAFPLRHGQTSLSEDDYGFLRRFLDATKANLFFARGVLVVEGDAEHLLLPVLADRLGRSLTASGVSIVNVGHRGLFRYSRVFQRTDGSQVPIPVACIADRDIPPDAVKGFHKGRPKKTESDYEPEKLAKKGQSLAAHSGGCVKVFSSTQWTLEYDLALAGMAVEVHQAVCLVRSQAEDTAATRAAASAEVSAWWNAGQSAEQVAANVFKPLFAKKVSKAMVAERLAGILAEEKSEPSDFRKKVPAYLVDAIEYATTPLDASHAGT